MDSEEKKKLVDAVFKGGYGDGVVALLVYRPIAYILIRVFGFKISPNKITISSFIFQLIASFIMLLMRDDIFNKFSVFIKNITHIEIYKNDVLLLLFFVIIYNLAAVFDCLDGAIARYYNLGSPKGKVLDSVLDEISDVVIYAALFFAFPTYLYYVLFFILTQYFWKSYKRIPTPAKETFKKMPTKIPVLKIRNIKIPVIIGKRDYRVATITLFVIVFTLEIHVHTLVLLALTYWVFVDIIHVRRLLRIAKSAKDQLYVMEDKYLPYSF
ncbi:MAG: CDP-alcohol phosphatidyltransferase family protein [Candidatus Njordarchaeia archaeon]